MSKKLSPDAVKVAECLSPVRGEYRTRAEMSQDAFGKRDPKTVSRVKRAVVELSGRYKIFRRYNNDDEDDDKDNKIPIGWSFRFSVEGFRKFSQEVEV